VPAPLSKPPLLLALFLIACGGGDGGTALSPDAGSSPDAQTSNWPAPNDDLVAAVGTPDTLDVATWNIENYPWLPTTPGTVADLIASMELDFIAVQEIQSVTGFNELVARLPDHDGILSEHTYGSGEYQKVGYIFRRDMMQIANATLLFRNAWYEFPRPPMQLTVLFDDGVHESFDFTAITVHLKAGQDTEEEDRRAGAIEMLEAHMRQNVDGIGDDDIVLLGDFNQTLFGTASEKVLSPILTATSDYTVQTQGLADQGAVSHFLTDRLIDHIVTTSALNDDLVGGATVIPEIQREYSGYYSEVSDHLPVVLRIPLR
jgi:endonuclease/exonuclease/phosphatase family metal-dependent hydrolase